MKNNENIVIKNIDKDSFHNATYLISYFLENGKEVSFQQLNRLLYLLEAIYMAVTNDDSFYQEEFSATNFELMNPNIIENYKKYNMFPIELEDNHIEIPDYNIIFINGVFQMFGEFSTSQLISFTTRKDSPWDIINKKYNEKIPKDTIISKKETKNWFTKLVKIEK